MNLVGGCVGCGDKSYMYVWYNKLTDLKGQKSIVDYKGDQ